MECLKILGLKMLTKLLLLLGLINPEISEKDLIEFKRLTEFDQVYHNQIDSINSLTKNEKLSLLIYEQSKRYGFNPVLIARQIWTESRFNPNVQNPETLASGYMQITPGTARLYNVDFANIFDESYNIETGLKILAEKLEKYGTLEKAFASYHGGHVRAKNWPDGDQGKTKYYVQSILGD
jgi:soluble lytic murein transglycosylase-like protein